MPELAHSTLEEGTKEERVYKHIGSHSSTSRYMYIIDMQSWDRVPSCDVILNHHVLYRKFEKKITTDISLISKPLQTAIDPSDRAVLGILLEEGCDIVYYTKLMLRHREICTKKQSYNKEQLVYESHGEHRGTSLQSLGYSRREMFWHYQCLWTQLWRCHKSKVT